MKSVNTVSSEGIEVYSVDYTLSDATKRDICNALVALRKDPNILDCQIEGYSVWGSLKQFDSTIDDPDRKEIPNGDAFEFRSDIQRLLIKRTGAISFIAYNKWDYNQTLTFEIE